MRLRAQPPVHSPIGLAALLAGAGGLLAGGTARDRVERLLRESYLPSGLLLTDSGTTALHLALRLAVAERPGPVALPAYCCYDIATAADAAGVSFVLYDLDPTSLGPDWASLRRALDRGAQVVVAVHLYGMPVDLPALESMVASAGAVVIEDAAQAAGARLGHRPAGSAGRYAVLSFGRGKGMTGGRGGALLANTPDAAERLATVSTALEGRSGSARDAATLLAQWLLARPSIYGLPLSIPSLRLGETIYRLPSPPAAPSSFAAGVLTRTLRLASAEAERRRSNARWLLERIPAGGAGISTELAGGNRTWIPAPAGARGRYDAGPLPDRLGPRARRLAGIPEAAGRARGVRLSSAGPGRRYAGCSNARRAAVHPARAQSAGSSESGGSGRASRCNVWQCGARFVADLAPEHCEVPRQRRYDSDGRLERINLAPNHHPYPSWRCRS